MRPIQIIVDSCADLTSEMLQKYHIDYVRMNTVEDGKETPASLTWEYFSPKEMYDKIRSGIRITTTQVPVSEFMRLFPKYLDEGCDIIYIGCSTKQSGSVGTGLVVSRELCAAHPEARIAVIDSQNSSIGQGLLGIRASELAAEGVDFDTIVSTIHDLRKYMNQYVTVNTLSYLARAGRVKGSKAFFGNLMGVKPILVSDAEGYQTPIKKVKGRLPSFAEIVDLMAEAMDHPEEKTLYLAHSDCSEAEITRLKELVSAKIPCKKIETLYIGPIIGASVGPDAIGLWAWGKEVTYHAQEG